MSTDSQSKEQEIHLPDFFDKYPELKEKMVEYLKTIPPAEKQKNLEEFNKFISGELTWGEIRKISKRMQKELARVAYLKFKLRDYAKSETMFKGLAIVDHTNWYYRAALGAVYQKQRKYQQAIEEYVVASELNPDEMSCVVNRGECYLMIKDFESAERDFDVVLNSALPANNPWMIRTKALRKRMITMKKEEPRA